MPKPNHKDDIVRVRHMLDFAHKAVQFNKGRSRADLDSNEMLAMATIHLIELIGEASRTISAELRHRYPEIPWDLISGTRNRLAHGYIDVDLGCCLDNCDQRFATAYCSVKTHLERQRRVTALPGAMPDDNGRVR